MKKIKITETIGKALVIQSLEDAKIFLDAIFEEGADGNKYEFEVVEISSQEYAALNEFDGF